MNVKHIAATLAILGSSSFALVGCNKNKEGTETPAADAQAGEGSCGAKKDGSCGGAKDAPGGDAPADAAGGDAPAAEGDAAAAPPAGK
jgi:hypothetical protein